LEVSALQTFKLRQHSNVRLFIVDFFCRSLIPCPSADGRRFEWDVVFCY
jgi:very-short-patch-repair endonuclease